MRPEEIEQYGMIPDTGGTVRAKKIYRISFSATSNYLLEDTDVPWHPFRPLLFGVKIVGPLKHLAESLLHIVDLEHTAGSFRARDSVLFIPLRQDEPKFAYSLEGLTHIWHTIPVECI